MIFSMGMLCPFRMGQPPLRKLFSAKRRINRSALPCGRQPVTLVISEPERMIADWSCFTSAEGRNRRLPLVAVLGAFLCIAGTAHANKFPPLNWSVGPDLSLATQLADAGSDVDNPGRPELAFD